MPRDLCGHTRGSFHTRLPCPAHLCSRLIAKLVSGTDQMCLTRTCERPSRNIANTCQALFVCSCSRYPSTHVDTPLYSVLHVALSSSLYLTCSLLYTQSNLSVSTDLYSSAKQSPALSQSIASDDLCVEFGGVETNEETPPGRAQTQTSATSSVRTQYVAVGHNIWN